MMNESLQSPEENPASVDLASRVSTDVTGFTWQVTAFNHHMFKTVRQPFLTGLNHDLQTP